MRTRRRLLGLAAGFAAALLIGRWLSTVLADRWYADVMDIVASVDGRLRLEAWLRLGTGLTALMVGLVNLLAVRQSIVSMVVPRQLGDLTIGEAVPSALLTAGAVGVAAVIGIAFAALPPATLTVQLALDGVRFGVEDPYLFRDVGFYVAWIPFERWLFDTVVLMYGTVVTITAMLYLATPSIRREDGRWRLSPWVRRHLGLLGGLGVLLWAWSWRLEGIALVGAGDGSFGAVAHHVLVPAYRFAVWAGVAGAVLIAYAAWSARIRFVWAVLAGLVLVGPGGEVVLREVGRRQGSLDARVTREAPYTETRRAFAGWGQDTVVGRLVAMDAVAANSPGLSGAGSPAPARSLDAAERFLPGAGRYALVDDTLGTLRAPAFQPAWRRLALAWALRTPTLVWAGGNLDAPKLLTRRDPIERLASVYPFLSPVGAARLEAGPTGPVWAVDLFVLSADFPLIPPGPSAVQRARYIRRAGIGVVDATTGAVGLRLTRTPDPVLRAWMAIAPDLFTPKRLIPDDAPERSAEDGLRDATGADGAGLAMRAAFDSAEAASRRGDVRAFEGAWARLGRLLGRRGP